MVNVTIILSKSDHLYIHCTVLQHRILRMRKMLFAHLTICAMGCYIRKPERKLDLKLLNQATNWKRIENVILGNHRIWYELTNEFALSHGKIWKKKKKRRNRRNFVGNCLRAISTNYINFYFKISFIHYTSNLLLFGGVCEITECLLENSAVGPCSLRP